MAKKNTIIKCLLFTNPYFVQGFKEKFKEKTRKQVYNFLMLEKMKKK